MEHVTAQQLLVRNCSITVKLQRHVIHISNDHELGKLLSGKTEAATDELVAQVKHAYQRFFGEVLNISDASLAVEIWGHVYFEYLVKVTEQKLDWRFLTQLGDKGTAKCEKIE